MSENERVDRKDVIKRLHIYSIFLAATLNQVEVNCDLSRIR